MDLTEAEDIKKRWQDYTKELYKKDLHDPDHRSTALKPQLLKALHLEPVKQEKPLQ